MKVATVSEPVASTKETGRDLGDRAKPGDFDTAMAAVFSLVNPAQAGKGSGQTGVGEGNVPTGGWDEENSEKETALRMEPGNAGLTESDVLFHCSGPAGLMPLEPTEAGAAGNAGKTPAQGTLQQELLSAPILQQSGASSVKETQILQGLGTPAGAAGGTVQTAEPPKGQAAVQTQRGVAGVPEDSPVSPAAAQSVKGAIPPANLLSGQSTASTDPASGPSLEAALAAEQPKPLGMEGKKPHTEPAAAEGKAGAQKPESVKTCQGADPLRPGERVNQQETVHSHQTQSNPTGFGAAQSNPAQPEANLVARSMGDLTKGVGIAELKDRVAVEIRRFATAHKGEPQTQVQLKLEPEHLGHLTIKLFFHKGELSAHFYTANSQVRDILEGSIQQLRETLGQQDLKLNEAMVFNGSDGRGGMGRFYEEKQWQDIPYYGGRHQHTYGEAREQPAEWVVREPTSLRVNYLV
ncbi:MAG: flagellar hook-length control protein FliK [Firmicutes bacterium]|nr:flagellar hook-length control protein FliK [Bacillota bacterium]